jgi:hypothetical protein
MDLSTLPLVVLQTLIECVDPQSLVAISYTCGTLNIEANRRLYRSPYTFFENLGQNRTAKLLLSLRPPHSGLPFLRTYCAIYMQDLSDLWSKSKINLRYLRFESSCFEDHHNTETSSQCFDSKLPGTSVTEVEVCWPDDTRNVERTLSLLDVLHRLEDLVTLTILDLSSFYRSTPDGDTIINAINCPHLKQLYISDSDILPCLRHKLPSLEVLWIEGHGSGKAWTYSDSKHYTPPEKWKRLECIMDRRILFIDTHASYKVVQSLPFVFSYANRYRPVDSTTMATWLLQSHHLLNDHIRLARPWAARDSLDISLFSIHSRDKTIPLLYDFDYKSLRLRLYANDAPLAAQLPQSLVSLYLETSDHRGSLSVVPNIVLTLSKLKKATIQLNVEIDDQDRWKGFEELLPPLDFYGDSDSDGGEYIFCHYKLQLHRDGVLFWEFTRAEFLLTGSAFLHEEMAFEPTNEVHIPELEEAVTYWLSLNPIVDTITVILSPKSRAGDDYIDEELP